MGFLPFWKYISTNAVHADGLGVYTSEENLNLSTIHNFHSKTNVIDGSLVNGSRQPILYTFLLDKAAGYKLISQPETVLFKNLNKSIWISITFCLENDNIEEVDFKQETLTF